MQRRRGRSRKKRRRRKVKENVYISFRDLNWMLCYFSFGFLSLLLFSIHIFWRRKPKKKTNFQALLAKAFCFTGNMEGARKRLSERKKKQEYAKSSARFLVLTRQYHHKQFHFVLFHYAQHIASLRTRKRAKRTRPYIFNRRTHTNHVGFFYTFCPSFMECGSHTHTSH